MIVAAMLFATITNAVPPVEDWEASCGYNDIEDVVRGITASADGGFLAVGTADDSTNADAYYRFTQDGFVPWFQTPGMDDVDLYDVTQDPNQDNTYYAIGTRRDPQDVSLIHFHDQNDEWTWLDVHHYNLPSAYGLSVDNTPGGGLVMGGEVDGRALLMISDGNLDDPTIVEIDMYYRHRLYDVKATSDGGYIGCGFVFPSSQHPKSQFWVVKTDANGAVQWDYVAGGNGADTLRSVAEVPNGDFIVCGTRENSPGNPNFWTTRLTADGANVWTREYGSSSGEEYGFWVDNAPDDGFYLGGTAINSYSNGADAWLVLLNENGLQVWTDYYGGENDQFAYAWTLLPDNSIAVAGNMPDGEDMQAWAAHLMIPESFVIAIEPDDPDLIMPVEGGTFGYTVSAANNSTVGMIKDAWISIMHLDTGNAIELQYFESVGFAPLNSVSAHLNQYMPAVAPPGTYRMSLFVGNHPWYPQYINTFEFDKETPVRTDMSVFDHPEMWPSTVTYSEFDVGADMLAGFSPGVDMLVTSDDELPAEFGLGNAYPNPFNPTTTLNVTLPESAELTVTVYNIAGQQVATLADGTFPAGAHALTFDGSTLSSGVYFIIANANSQLATQKVVLMK